MRRKTTFGINTQITILGIVSFLTDVSSEMIFSVLSIFLTVILGASTTTLGIIEGLADFAASSLDFVSGYWSDKTGKRKIFAVTGYGFSTAAKAILIFASTTILVGAVRIIERLGKSIRGPPRDALISAIAQKNKIGYAFGLHKAMDKTGAILGPIIAYFLLSAFGQNANAFKTIFLIAFVPAIISVIILLLFVKDKREKKKHELNIFSAYSGLGKEYKHYLKTTGIFSIAYFSFAFLLLKAYSVGFAIKDVALLYALFNISFTTLAIPIGKLGDKIGRTKIITTEYLIYAIMCVGFIFATTKMQVILLFLLYGIFYTIDEAQTKAYITDITDKKTRATAIGIYNFVTGMIYLPASLIAGTSWNYFGANYAFGFAAIISVISAGFFLNKKNYPQTLSTAKL